MLTALLQCPAWGRDCPPYTLAYFKALLERSGHPTVLYDLNNRMFHSGGPALQKFWTDKDYYSAWETPGLLKELIDGNCDLLDATVRDIVGRGVRAAAFTTHTTSYLISAEVARRLKAADPTITILFGGPQCSRSQAGIHLIKFPEVDYVCHAEGDIAFPQLLRELEAGSGRVPAGFWHKKGTEVIDTGDPEIVADLDSLPYPDYEPFRADMEAGLYRERNRLDIFDSRGCVTCCHFCSEWQFWKRYRTLSGRRIFDEINYQMARFPWVDYFYFNGSLVNGDLAALEEWCDLVIASGKKIRWAGQAIARPDMSRELIFKMKAAGCSWLGIGIESGSQDLIDRMNKRYRVEESLRILKDAFEAGILVQINIMFGIPTETREDFQATLDFLRRARPYIETVLASQSFCVIDKGTYLHRHPEQFGITGQDHHLFWESNGGENTFVERFRRYEEFCRLALSLDVPETSGVLAVKPDKWLLLGQYYEYRGEREKAALCYEESFYRESPDPSLIERARRLQTEAMKKVRGFLDECGAAVAAASKPRPVRCLPPRELHLELTYACNARCVMCNLRHLPPPERGDLTPAEIEKLVTESALLKDIGFIVLSGGEAVLRPDLPAIVQVLRKRYPAVEILILSNLLDTRRVSETVAAIERTVGLEHISIGSSIDGVGAAHDRVRGREGSFSALCESLNALRSSWPGLYVSLNFTLTPENYDQMMPVYRWSREVRYPVSFQVLVQKAETRQFLWDDAHRKEISRQIDALMCGLIEDSRMEVRSGYELTANPGLLSQLLSLHYMDKYINDPRRYFVNCPCGEQFAMLAPSGDLYFCPVLKQLGPGTVREVPFDELWSSPAAEKIRRGFEQRACHCWLTCSNSRMLEDALNQGLKPFMKNKFLGGN